MSENFEKRTSHGAEPEQLSTGKNEKRPGEGKEGISEKTLRSMDKVKAVVETPHDDWVANESKKGATGGMQIFNNFRYHLPGGHTYKLGKTHHRKLYSEIDDALFRTGTSIDEISELNQQSVKLEEELSKYWRNKSTDSPDNDEIKQKSKEHKKLLAEIHYKSAPAAIHLMQKGYEPGSLFG